MLLVERHHGRIADELFPVDGLRAGIFMNMVLPGASITVTVSIRLYQVHMPQQTSLDDILSGNKAKSLSVLVTYLENSL